MRLAMSLGKILVIASVAVVAIRQDLPYVLIWRSLSRLPMFAGACELVFFLALKLAAVLILWRLRILPFRRWQHSRDLRMTKQEVKEELKRMDGDPLMKQRRTRVARQLALQRIGQAVPKRMSW